MSRKILYLLVALLLPLQGLAQRFTASIEDVGGYYRLSFTINALGATNFTPPSLAAFDILNGPSSYTSSNYQMINGKTSHSESKTFTYILSAHKSGRITIGPASISVNGRTIHSNPISINVKGNSSQGGSASRQNSSHANTQQQEGSGVQQSGSPVTQRDLFIDVTPSRTRVKEQEAVLLTYRIHSRVGVGLSNTSLMQKPDFKGLISQELPIPGNQIQTSLEHRGGTTYRTGNILQYVVFPQKSGNIVIPSITFNCAVIQQDNTMDLADLFFNGGGTMSVQVKRTVPQITLHVDPLPSPRPTNFSGAVGKFSLNGKVLNPTVKTNDVATYRITLSGLGNLKLITAPIVEFPKDFDTYDAKTNDNTKVSANGLHGELTFDYTFVPRNVGDYTIPAVHFVYFHTSTNSYHTIHTQPIH
uniref:BatD family protein n=1 Tax=Alloprevotella sp. TaxID=1872471 RepID=UPI004026C390